MKAQRWWWPWLLLAVLAALLAPSLVPRLASAQSTTSTSKLSAIRESMERGQALYVAGNLEAAAEVFDSGFEKYKFPAFRFNAGICYQKLGQLEVAEERFEAYLEANPEAPDADRVRQRIAALQAERQPTPPPPATPGTGGAAGGPATGTGAAPTGPGGAPPAPSSTAPPPAPPPAPPAGPAPSTEERDMKSVVLVETEPAGAPLVLYAPRRGSAAPFVLGGQNPDWFQVAATRSPASLTLDVGRYQVVVEKFRDFNAATQEVQVSPGRVLHFVANLSQGAFMSFLRVSANVRGAAVYLDDPAKQRPEWGLAPHSELVSAGSHALLVEAPGYEPYATEFDLQQGEQRFVEVTLSRVGYGLLRIDANAPEVAVEVDAIPVGVWRSGQPPLEVKLAAGPRQVEITSKGRKTLRSTVEIPPGQVLPVHAEMIPNYPRGAAWTQAVIGAAFVGTGVGLGLESNRLHDQLEQDRESGALEQSDPRILRGKLFAIGADAGFAVGGILGILATYNFIKDPLPESSQTVDPPVEFGDPAEPPSAARGPRSSRVARETRQRGLQRRVMLSPVVGEQGGGLAIGGRF